jgi:uncharacterized protein YjiS (DUF1127 family)
METEMSARYPVLPIAAGASLRAFAAVLALVIYWAKQMVRVRRHRREAAMLAGVDGRMLADIGITRSDVRDAFSEPFWEDPTALLRERALERRWNSVLQRDELANRASGQHVESGFRRPSTDRPARQAV